MTRRQQHRSHSKTRPRVQITRIGLWFCLFVFIIAVAASNTGNNALYMVVATMASLLIVSVVSGYANLTGLEIEALPGGECYVGETAQVPLRVANRSRWLPKWLIQVCLLEDAGRDLGAALNTGALVSHLIRRRRGRKSWCDAVQQLTFERRGRRRFEGPTLSTLFPFGLLRVTRHLRMVFEVVVFPQLIEGTVLDLEVPGAQGEETARRSGFGHDLYALRNLRPGDDPRGIHWKQSARTGRMIYQQRTAEEGSRVSVVFDNGIPPGSLDELSGHFERAVSEAASLAVEYMKHDYEVELITRDVVIPYCGGEQGRLLMLEALALIEPIEGDFEPLLPDTGLSTVERRFEVGFSDLAPPPLDQATALDERSRGGTASPGPSR